MPTVHSGGDFTPQQLTELLEDVLTDREDEMFVAFSAAPTQHDGSTLI
jgi:hypothetical protein